MLQPETRPSLIVRIKDQRNELAWREFVQAYEPFLQQLVRRQGTPDSQVPDATQQLLLAIARSVEGWNDDGRSASFRRWLGRVARNTVSKLMSRERRQIAGQGGTDFLQLMQETPDEVLDEQRSAYDHELVVWAARQVRGEFRETSWQAFWGTIVEGRTVADVAAELRVSVGSIYMSRSRILARIRSKIHEVTDES